MVLLLEIRENKAIVRPWPIKSLKVYMYILQGAKKNNEIKSHTDCVRV